MSVFSKIPILFPLRALLILLGLVLSSNIAYATDNDVGIIQADISKKVANLKLHEASLRELELLLDVQQFLVFIDNCKMDSEKMTLLEDLNVKIHERIYALEDFLNSNP